MANANSGLTQFKELHIMRVGKTWGWSARRYCIKLVTFLKNILCPHRAFTKASDFTSQIAVSNPPYDRNISSFREFVSFRIWVVPFLLLSHPRSQCPETLGFSCLCCMPSHPFDTVRVSPGHPQITTPPQPVLTWLMPKTTYRPGSPNREDSWKWQKTVWSIQVPWKSNQSVSSVSSS